MKTEAISWLTGLRLTQIWRSALAVFLLMLPTATARAESPRVERVDDTFFIQIEADSFYNLKPKQKALAYWLNQSSIALNPIVYDQLSRFGLRQKRLLEAVVSNKPRVDPAIYARVLDFTKLFWANKGNHDSNERKFMPRFTSDELKEALGQAGRQDLIPEVDSLAASLFDAEFEPVLSPKNLMDEQSREQFYRAGTVDGRIAPGLYAQYLTKANQFLEKARAYAEPRQAKVLSDLIHFYQTGEQNDWIQFEADWVRDDEPVDFMSGFTGSNRDFHTPKGTLQSFVCIADREASDIATKIAANAQYFEDHAPWDARYKRQDVKVPVAKIVETTIEAGDFPVATMSASFPSEDRIRSEYGSKNFFFFDEAPSETGAVGFAGIYEFYASRTDAQRDRKYLFEQERLMTILHEVIGHGSGKVSPRLAKDPQFYLKEYYPALEEARADLMALWSAFDPKLKELGLVSSDEVAKAMYDIVAVQMITQLRLFPHGDTIEDNRARARQLIARYLMEKTGAIGIEERDGLTTVYVKDYARMRKGVGMLLSELTRIKAEGDYEAIKALTDKYGSHIDSKLRDQMVERFRKLGSPTTSFAGINPNLVAQFDRSGTVIKVDIEYPRDYVKQQLGYSAMYREH